MSSVVSSRYVNLFAVRDVPLVVYGNIGWLLFPVHVTLGGCAVYDVALIEFVGFIGVSCIGRSQFSVFRYH